MQTKNKFLIIVAAFALLAMVVPTQAATWDTTRVYTGTVTLYDVAVGNKIKGASDDTVRIFYGEAGSPYKVLLFTDRSSALPMSWSKDSIMVDTAAIRAAAIGDPDGDGDNDLIWGRSSSPYRVKRAYWTGSAWANQIIGTMPGSIYDIAVGDIDNNALTPDDIVLATSYYVYRARWNGATWDTSRIFPGSSTLGTIYGVAIGDFDAAHPGNEIVAVSYNQKVFEIKWNGASFDTATIYSTATDLDFYDVAVGDFDASNTGDEIAINNGYGYAANGAILELYGSGASWSLRALYTPATWSSSGEIAVGDFFTTNPGAEIIAVSGSSPYEARLVYGSGASWFSERTFLATSSTYGCAIGNVNRYRPGNELALTSYYRVFEEEQKLLNNDMAAISVDGVPSMVETDDIVTIKATVRNNSEYTANAPIAVKLRIDGPLGYVYTDPDQATTINLLPGGTEQIIFTPDWIVPDTLCTYTIKVWTELAGDEIPANDTVTKLVTVIRAGGLVEQFTGTTFPPPGWTVYNFGTVPGDPWIRYTAYFNSPPACAQIYYDVPNNDWLITPRVRAQDGDKLKFWWRTHSTSYTETLFVRVSINSDVSDTGSYLLIDQVSSTATIAWSEKVIDLSTYAGQDIYIAFWYRCNNNYGMAIDDVSGPYFPTQIELTVDSLYFESFPDMSFCDSLYIGNMGGGLLEYEITIAHGSSWLSVDPDAGTVPGGQKDTITVCVNTSGLDGHYYDTLIIVSNSGEKQNGDTALVPIHIWVRLIPNIAVSPDSFAVAVEGNGTKDTLMFLSNSGNGNLEYTIETEEWSKFGVLWDGEPATRPHRVEMTESEARELGSKGGDDPRRGTPPAKGMGGPDAFGYRWIDSDEAGGPTFNWIEINSIGNLLSITDDGNVGPFAIGFPFEFYGVTFDSFRVASNGFATFTSTSGTLTNDTIPSPPEPNNLLALMWDDLRSAYGGGAGNIYYHSNSERLVIEYDHVIRYGQTTCPYTMEIVLYPNGKIIYQYKQMGDGTCTYLNQSTIGIENGTGTDGLEVVFNANYVHDNMAIRFSAAPSWLVFSPELGTIPPGESDTIDITFDATGILSGDFYGAFIITSNDPDTPVDTVPAHMTILVPDMTFDPASIETSGTEGQAPFDVTMDIGNAGAGRLIFNIVEGTPWLSVSPVADTIPPGDPATTITLTIDCTNLYAGNYQGQLKVYSNDPDFQPYATYDVALHVGPNPDIAVSPDSFYIGIYAGYTKDTSMTISNTGDGHLVWGTAIEELGKGADTTLYEDFEGTFPPAGWTVVNHDGGTVTWEQSTTYYHTGTHSASCRWESTTLWNDDWLITPRISIGSNDSLSFWYRAYSTTWPESLEVRLSTTTNDVSAFTTLLWAGSQLVNTTWEEQKIELGKYSRGQVYIAFVYKGLDEFRIYLDDVKVQSYAGPWLTVDPLSGITNPHSNTGVKLSFSAIGYENDMYANLWITSNDPDESPVMVPVHMAILGPNYSVSPPETLVINALEDQYTDGHVFMQNYGGHAPLAYKITDPVAWLSESPDTAEVPIDGEQDVTVTVDGNQLIAGDYATKLFIKSNDFSTPNDTLVVIVHMGPPPAISVDPDTLDPVQVLAGGTRDTVITVSNTGDGHLGFEITTEETGPKFAAGAGLNTHRESEILERNKHDYSESAPLLAGMGDNNPAHLTIGAPNAPGSPVIALGDTLFVQLPHDPADSWSFVTTDQGAGYTAYENFWDLTDPIGGINWWGLCLIYSGGWLAGNPANLVFDITFYSDPPDDPTLPPTQVACTYTDVVAPVITPTGLLYSGFQMYYFNGLELASACNLTEGWVSIKSKSAGSGYDWLMWASAKTGDGFSYHEGGTNPRYYDQAMILIGGGATWLTVSPEADTVDPLSSVNVTVHFDATEVFGGEKFGNVIIEHNAPGKGTTIVPVHMVVGGAMYAIDPQSLDIEALENQYTNAYLTISNPGGQGPLSYKMTAPVPWLSINPDTSMIDPDDNVVVTVRVDGYQLIAGNYSTEILVKTNAVNQQYDTIPVTVHIGPDPEVAIAPMSFDVGVFPGTTPTTRTIKVSNELGAGHLGFVTSIEETSPKLTAGRQGSVREQLEAIRNSVQPKQASEGAQKVIGFEKSTQTMPAKSGGGGTPGTPGGMLLRGGGKASILLVDDDGGLPGGTYSDIEDRYMDALDANGFVYDYYVVDWTDPLSPGPDLATMQNYGCVIWFTGETWGYYGDDTFTPTDETNVAAYLDGGGNLFLSAQDYLWDMYPSAGSFSPGQFPYDYLGLQSASQDVINDPYIAYGLAGSVAAGMQFDALRCFDLNPTVPLWTDDLTGQSGTVDVFDASGFISAVQYDAGTFKTVFTTTEFAGLVDASPSTRAELMASILDWFGCVGPGCPFTATPAADTLDPGTSIDVLLTFDGTAFEACGLETLTCYLVFNTNDPDEALVTVPVTMWSQRGDVDDDGVINVVDVVFLLNYIFIDGPAPDPPCLGDVNKDGNENSDDVLYLISYLFLGGPPPKILLAPSR